MAVKDWSTTAADNDNADAAINWLEGQAAATVNNSARAMMAEIAKLFGDTNGTLTTGGTSSAYTVTTNNGYSAYFDGMPLIVSPNADNAAGGVTLNADAIGTASIKLIDGTDPYAGAMQSGGQSFLLHDGTNFILLNPYSTDQSLLTTDTPTFAGINLGDENLDHYDEGTWTPVLTFATPGDLSVAYSTQYGSYIRIGKLVTVQFSVITSTFTHTTASSFVRITGLPVTVENVAGQDYIGAMRWQGITKAGITHIVCRAFQNSTEIDVLGSGSGTSAVFITAADMPSGGTVNLIGSLSYLAA